MDAVKKLLQPKSVAIIGASADPGKTAGRPIKYLLKHGFGGAIYPVNPRVANIGGLRCYPNVASLPETPDVAVILLGAEQANRAVADLSQLGTAAAIVLAGGYTEVGGEGVRRQEELLRAAGPMRILGPNTIGLVNLNDRIVLSASGALELDALAAGTVGVVSQSGGILGALLSRATARGIGLSKLISTSNEADLELSDFIDYLVEDEATRVIALYLETIRDPVRFYRSAQKAGSAGKPIVAFKTGRSEAGARAAVSHTGALAGSDRMYDALFNQLGIIRAETFDELLDIPAALATGRKLMGKRIAILTSTGGAGTLVSDSLGLAGFDVPAPDASTGNALRSLQNGDHTALDRNPIDVTLAGLQPDLLRSAIRILLASPGYDALAIIFGASSLGRPELMADAIQECLAESNKPVVGFVSPYAPNVLSTLTRRGVPAYFSPEACAAALRGLYHASHWHPLEPAEVLSAAALALQDDLHGMLDEAQAKALFARFGIPCVREYAVRDGEEALAAARRLGGPVVLKVLSNAISHKSDIGGVAVGVAQAELPDRLERMAAEVQKHIHSRPARFLIQELIGGGWELILGMHRDALGTAIMLGMGGVAAEIVKDVVFQLLPPGRGLSREEALGMIRSLRSWPLLDGYRGATKADIEALAEAVVKFSGMVNQLGNRLLEAEINPIFVLPAGQGVRAADGVVSLEGLRQEVCNG